MTLNNTVTLKSWQARSQKCEMGGGQMVKVEGQQVERQRRENRGGLGRRCPPPQWGRGLGTGLAPLPRIFLNFLSRYAAFWVQSNAFSDITRPVPNSQHSQPAESSAIIKPAVPHWVRDAGHIKGFWCIGASA